MMNVNVCKFGGSSVANAEQFRKAADIIRAKQERRYIVVSAPGKSREDDIKVTDLLIRCAESKLAGEDPAPVIDDITSRYVGICEGLGLTETVPNSARRALEERLALPLERDALLDAIKAIGEEFSAMLLAEYLNALGEKAVYVTPDMAGMIVTGEFGNAELDESCYGTLSDYLKSCDGVVCFPGFYGFTREGRIATFSRGGSDLTGSILAAAVDASVYENFTDVDGIFMANPKVVDSPKIINEVTYGELRELTYSGFNVFHDEAMYPIICKKVPINVRNTNNPDHPGTMIRPDREAVHGEIVGIAALSGFCSVFVSKYLMNRERGIGRRLLEIIESEGLNYEHSPTGIDNISVLLREADLDDTVLERIKKRFRDELKADRVEVEHGMDIIAVVGKGMKHTPGIAAKITAAFAESGVNIEMINQGPSELSVILGVKGHQSDEAVRAIYNAFVQ
jgi:aspartate kinase